MKKTLILLFVCMLCMPLYAQLKLGPKARRIRSGRLLQPRTSTLASRINARFHDHLRQRPSTTTFPKVSINQRTVSSAAFQILHSKSPFTKAASGFAIDFGDGTVKGISAAHVFQNMGLPGREPHIKLQTGEHSFIIVPIDRKSIVVGNPEGVDLAIFDLPANLLPYVTVWHPAEHAPAAGEKVTIQGFLKSNNLFFTLPNQTVLFNTFLKVFIEKTTAENLVGTCGSPIGDGKHVSAIYMGFSNAKKLVKQEWFNKLPKETQHAMTATHYAVPIEVAKLMAKSIQETGSTRQGGIMMKALGHPVARMHFNQAIVSIEQFRNGEQVAKIEQYKSGEKSHKIHTDQGSPINPEQLELFFDLQDNDILRVSLNSFSLEHPDPVKVSTIYDVNVSTGEVTKVLGEDPL